MTRAFHGAAQGTQSAEANEAPGFDRVSPIEAAATMHNDLADDTKQVADGSQNVPIHPAQVPTEGSDTQETEGDGSVRDPSGQGFGT
jgi:hypothetical protein